MGVLHSHSGMLCQPTGCECVFIMNYFRKQKQNKKYCKFPIMKKNKSSSVHLCVLAHPF